MDKCLWQNETYEAVIVKSNEKSQWELGCQQYWVKEEGKEEATDDSQLGDWEMVV